MKSRSRSIRLSATDLTNHLSCAHLTNLNLSALAGDLKPPPFRAPDLVVLRQLGLKHEEAYVGHLAHQGLDIADLGQVADDAAVRETVLAMQSGVHVIVQAALLQEDWFGRADVLRRVDVPSILGPWSYEPHDCRLARETKATTVLQLAHYAALLGSMQGRDPERFHIVPPSDDFAVESYRLSDFVAYYRAIRSRLLRAIGHRLPSYPEPTAFCDVCRWFPDCNQQRRRDDHLAFTAGINRLQRKQLIEWEVATMEGLASLPLPISRRPRHGAKEGYERVREQSRVQVAARFLGDPVHEVLAIEAGRGLSRLPEPSEGDLFFDLESDPFSDKTGREYLFGFATKENGTPAYERRWATNAPEEKAAFEWFVDLVIERWKQFPAMHVYHFGHKEPSTLKALMGRHATREEAVDKMLRAGMMVDLHAIVKQSIRASVEEYSLKALEAFHAFARNVPLEEARGAMRQIEHTLQLGKAGQISKQAMATVEGYNADDCYSTESLRNWLECVRLETINSGTPIERPSAHDGTPSEALGDRYERVAQLIAALTKDTPLDGALRSEEQSAKWLLANLLDWHRREDKVAYWEKYRLRDMGDEGLQDERAAIAGLRHVRTIPPQGRQRLPTDEYTFPQQETSLQEGDELYQREAKIGKVEFIDPVRGIVRIKKTQKSLATHPSSVYSYEVIDNAVLAESLFKLGESVRDHGLERAGHFRSACDLLLRRPPRTVSGTAALITKGESVVAAARRIAPSLDSSVLAIQGPPGAGKTYTGARMIVELIRQGKRVGVTAGSHRVIRKLLDETRKAAVEAGLPRAICLQKVSEKSDGPLPDWLAETTDNGEARWSIENRAHDVVAGTPWLWSRADMQGLADVLFVDEAGQMSLANALAIAPAAKSVILLGDPQQLDQPLKGTHPEGADASALQHLLNGANTIPAERGLFLETTWRLHPDICKFTSEVFYESRLFSSDGLENQRIEGHRWLGTSGLRYLPVRHDGNQNVSIEEVDYIVELVGGLLSPGVSWVDEFGHRAPFGVKDLLIVAPYNAQVALLSSRLPNIEVGTVDKFQGQEAPVVIYSMTTSSPEDAPRGMEFLYSLNRLNVATSRARALAILVASPKLLQPEAKTPRQMQLANALCRYVELAEGTEEVALGAG